MIRTAVAGGLFVLLAASVPAADKPLPEDIRAAIEDANVAAIERASPSVVCILVSRSEEYKQFGPVPSAEWPGRLGAFDGDKLSKEADKKKDRTRLALISRLDLADEHHVPESFGSGIVIDPSGLILTNYHVVREATKVYVRVPGLEGSYADIHAADPRSDLAVLKLLKPPRDLKALPLGQGEKVRKGQFVLALTNSFLAGFRDKGPSANWGIVSDVLQRQEVPNQDPEYGQKLSHFHGSLIQTDARLNAACSGGALLNIRGELIGITSSLAAVVGGDAPGGFAIPTTAAMRRIIETLKAGREVEYGFLGVKFGNGEGNSTHFTEVTPGSPAALAGIPPNQYLVRVDGVPTRNRDDLYLGIGAALAGRPIKVEVAPRPGARGQEYPVTLVKFYIPGPFIASERPPAVGGLRVDYTSTLIRSAVFNPRILPGVVVREVLPNSPAARANMAVDRVITKVNGRSIANPAEYYNEVRRSTGPLELTFNNQETVKLERE